MKTIKASTSEARQKERAERIAKMKGLPVPGEKPKTEFYPDQKHNMFSGIHVISPPEMGLTRKDIEPVLCAHTHQGTIANAVKNLKDNNLNFAILGISSGKLSVIKTGFQEGL
jgi:hypothetical protein